MSEQVAQLDRVKSTIGPFVIEFFDSLAIGTEFHASDLRDFVTSKNCQIAPSSPDRVMRELRKQSVLNYELVSRSKSLYRKASIEHEGN